MIPIERAGGAFADVRVLMTDIDDTMTLDGRLPGEAYRVLEALADAGIAVVPVTGRPAGWCDMIARMWPVSGVIGENGALWFSYDTFSRRMQAIFAQEEAERAANRLRLDQLAQRILAGVPGTALASDQPYRMFDLAIDHCEDVAPLPPAEISRILEMFEAVGATAKVSSIHVNGWFGSHDKLGMARRVLIDVLGIEADQFGSQVAFIGDSPNDEPMFHAFPLSVGVANVKHFLGTIQNLPCYVTQERGGDGFVAFANMVLAARKSSAAAIASKRGSH
ncbi:MAG: HAD family hydrolase [Proteobacteria bacterium]|nr:HAD family hydrolase [Pseudomonadota bacterium]